MTPNSNAIEQLNILTPADSRLERKQGVVVIDTGEDSGFDINVFIGEMREERIQDQIGLFVLASIDEPQNPKSVF
jgi:hypothetical protein